MMTSWQHEYTLWKFQYSQLLKHYQVLTVSLICSFLSSTVKWLECQYTLYLNYSVTVAQKIATVNIQMNEYGNMMTDVH